MSSLIQIASILAERASKKTDQSFILEMKDLAVIKRARFLENSLNKDNGLDKIYTNSFIVPLKRVNPANECEEDPDPCDSILRTVDKVPTPIRYGVHPFNFVGPAYGGKPYGWTTFANEPRLKALPLTGKDARHTYRNQYVYIFNEENVEEVLIEGVFPDQRLIAKFFACPDEDGNKKVCWKNEQDFFVEESIAELIIKDILQNELRIISRNEPTEVKPDKNV
jgi:hypothetical protein